MSFKIDLKNFGEKIAKSSNITLDEMVDDTFIDIKKRTPVDTGRARDGWKKEVTKDSGNIYNDVPYILALEHGHSKQAPHGMILGALAKLLLKIQSGKYKAKGQ